MPPSRKPKEGQNVFFKEPNKVLESQNTKGEKIFVCQMTNSILGEITSTTDCIRMIGMNMQPAMSTHTDFSSFSVLSLITVVLGFKYKIEASIHKLGCDRQDSLREISVC